MKRTRDTDGLLIWASMDGDFFGVQALVEGGDVNVNVQDGDGYTPLRRACNDGHFEVAKLLIAHGAVITVQADEEHGKTLPLHRYTRDNVEITKLLLENGLDANAKDDGDGWTSLHGACSKGYLEIASLLILHGAQVNPRLVDEAGYYDGLTPLCNPIQEVHTEVAKLLIENEGTIYYQNGWTLLHETCMADYLELVECQVENHVHDVNVRDNDGKTPLARACQKNRLETVKLLIRNGAHVNSKDNDGWTAIHWACSAGHFEIAKLLIQNGADCSIKDRFGWTALHLVCWEESSLEIAKLLVQAGANVNAKRGDGKAPLYLACWKGSLETANFFIENGAEINSPQDDGETELHVAARAGHLKVVQLLLSRRASLNAETVAGLTPLHLASEGNHSDVVWFLVREHPWLVAEHVE